jgi:hypothetical protein
LQVFHLSKEVHLMARFLIEVPHEAELVACSRVVEILLTSGSHFLTHADWGCMDGNHKAWIIVEVASKEEARSILPPSLRPEAGIVKLNYFTLEEIDAILQHHGVALQQSQRGHPRVEEAGEKYANSR